jgi:hypothetical protein
MRNNKQEAGNLHTDVQSFSLDDIIEACLDVLKTGDIDIYPWGNNGFIVLINRYLPRPVFTKLTFAFLPFNAVYYANLRGWIIPHHGVNVFGD